MCSTCSFSLTCMQMQLQHQQDLVEAVTNDTNKKIDDLRSELKKSKQLSKQLEDDAEKTKVNYDKLSKEYDELKSMEIEKHTAKKVVDRLSSCNLQLQKKFKPDFEVSS